MTTLLSSYWQYVIMVVFAGLCYYYMDKSEDLEAQIIIRDMSIVSLESALDSQNKAIKDLEVKIKLPSTPQLDHITIKDKTCEAELKAYKALFKELSK